MAKWEPFYERAKSLRVAADLVRRDKNLGADYLDVGRNYWAVVERDGRLRKEIESAGIDPNIDVNGDFMNELQMISYIIQELEEYFEKHPDNPKK